MLLQDLSEEDRKELQEIKDYYYKKRRPENWSEQTTHHDRLNKLAQKYNVSRETILFLK
jgi:hypothetical protein